MAFLTIGGVTVKVSVEGVSLSYVDVNGEQERSSSGTLEGGPTASKQEWRMTTTPFPESERAAWVGLIEGKGHVFPLNTSTYSARGKARSSGTGTIVTSGMKWGAGCLSVPVGTTGAVWALSLGTSWTLAWWSKDLGLGAWVHWVLRSDGAEWRNGVSVGPGTSAGEVAVSGGSVVVTGADGSDWYVDDVVALPYAVPSTWPAGMYALHATGAWASLPRVVAGGAFSTSTVTARGKVTGTRILRYSNAGTLTSGHMLEFTLREV